MPPLNKIKSAKGRRMGSTPESVGQPGEPPITDAFWCPTRDSSMKFPRRQLLFGPFSSVKRSVPPSLIYPERPVHSVPHTIQVLPF